MPIGLYFILWYEAGPGSQEEDPLSANTVLSIVTAAIGGSSILEYFLRVWRLWKQGSDCRVIGAQSRWNFDWFHWWFGLCLLIVVAELVLATAWHDPIIKLLSLPLASVQAVFGTVLLLTDILCFFVVRAPIRISSVPRGAEVRPGIYPLIEDICAVDGAGTTEFRKSLDRRYKTSSVFRAMLRNLSLFWAVGALASAAGTMFLVFDLTDTDVAYTIGWTVPFVWAGIWFLITIRYVQYMLRKELRQWVGEMILLDAIT
ncbi:hypothetical protein Daus18300_012161 [Diaporthe australafricana]|uniref:Uncharacterized protein n=1 Tax=Diaporthe australafricana TaxID=127596 RepID=A0ABR3W460_9PEZI